MNYIVVLDTQLPVFVENVNLAMEDGYEPIGGIAVTVAPNGMKNYHQSLVKLPSLEAGVDFSIEMDEGDEPDATAGAIALCEEYGVGVWDVCEHFGRRVTKRDAQEYIEEVLDAN